MLETTLPLPTRFIKKPKDNNQERLSIPRTCSSGHWTVKQLELKPLNINRSQYNRLIGDVIRADIDCHCNDLPTSEEVGYFDALLLRVSGNKNKTV